MDKDLKDELIETLKLLQNTICMLNGGSWGPGILEMSSMVVAGELGSPNHDNLCSAIRDGFTSIADAILEASNSR